MTWTFALFRMCMGEAVYRPHWKHNENIRAVRAGNVFTFNKYVGGIPAGLWQPSPDDLSAEDWQREEYIILKNR